MKELLLEIFGWLGYLERPSVLLQLGLVIAVVLLTRRAQRRRWLQPLPLRAYTPVGILTLAMACGVLAALGQPQGLVSLLRDLVLAGTAPDRLELTSVSPQFRQALPDLARSLGKARLLQWQAQLKGSEQQLRHSVNPRLWLEVLLLGLLAEPVAAAQPISAAAPTATAPAVAPLVAPPIAPAVAPAAAPIPTPAPAPAPVSDEPNSSAKLPELWQQILAGLELPSTRMLLSQQARLVRLDERRAVVQVAGNWMAMVQSRLPLLEAAVAKALGSPRQLTLEGGGESAAPTVTAPGAATPRPTPPPPTPAPLPSPAANQAPAPLPTPAANPPPAAVTAPPLAAPLDDKARRLAEFFNGEVVELDGPLDELTGDALTGDAAEAAA